MASGDRPAYRFLEEAEADFLEGLRHYADHDRDVARRFDQLIKRAVALIVENPGRWPTKNGSHRYVLRRFPYTVAYVFEADLVSIIAVAHHGRNPASWESRR